MKAYYFSLYCKHKGFHNCRSIIVDNKPTIFVLNAQVITNGSDHLQHTVSENKENTL
jgi:hypothetical protein